MSAVRYGVANRRVYVYVTVADAGGRRLEDAAVTVALYRQGKVYARAAGRTARGVMTFDRPASIGIYRTKVTASWRRVHLGTARPGERLHEEAEAKPRKPRQPSARPSTRKRGES